MREHSDKTAFLHDGSFCGFLCAAAEALNIFRTTGRIHEVCAPGDVGLFDDTVTVASDSGRAETVYRRLKAKAGEEALQRLLEAFCSGFENISRSLAIMAVRLWSEGPAVLCDLADSDVLAVEKAAHRTRAEVNLFYGLTRFSELSDGTWYAPINPQANILPLIADHFAARYPDMKFVIHDTERATALLHPKNGSWHIVPDFEFLPAADSLVSGEAVSPGELRVREAWKRYFNAVAIEERKNPSLQRGHMPKKYWRFLPEMDFGK